MRTLIAVLLSALLLTLHGSLLKNLETKAAVHPKAGQRHNATLTAKPSERVLTVQAAAPVAPPVQETPESQTTQVTGCESYRPLLAQYNWDVKVMFAVMQAESNCNPNAVSPPNYDGLRDFGLLQLHGQEIYNPTANIQAAYNIWLRQGYGAWSVWNSNAYLRYL